MAKWTALITDAGTALQANQVNGSTITLTRAVSGGSVTALSSLASLTEMSNIAQNLSLGTLTMDRVNSTFTVKVALNNENVTSKYNLRQVGIYAKDSQTNKEILFAIAQIDEAKSIDTPENAPGYNIEWEFKFMNPNDNKMAVVINNESLQEQMTFLQNNVSPSGEAEGSALVINNSANLPLVSLNVYGKSEQKTSTGINLLNPKNIGNFLNNNSANKTGAIVPIETDGKYTYYIKDTVTVYIGYTDSLESPATHFASNLKTAPASGTVDLKAGQYFMLWYDTGVSMTDTAEYFLALGTNVTYEPYTGGMPGPNPDYPLEINSVGDSGSVEVGVYGKNILAYPYKETTTTKNGLTFTDNGDGSITVNGTATTTTYFSLNDIPPLDVEIIASGCPKGGTWATYQISVDKNGLNNVNDYGDGVSVKCTKADVYSLTLVIRKDTKVSNLTFYPQVEIDNGKGIVSTHNQYINKQTLTLAVENGLPGIPVDNGGNYVDADGQHWVCDEVDLERGVYIQRIVCTEFNGSENWLKSTDNNNNYMYHTSLSANTVGSSDSMCNRLIDAGGTSPLQVEGQTTDLLGYFVSKKYNVLYVNMGYYMAENSVDELRTILADKPITVQYPLATPIETVLTDAEMQVYRVITTNEPNTTIMNNIGADMKAQYVPQLYGPLIGMIFNRMNTLMGDITAALDEINGEVV